MSKLELRNLFFKSQKAKINKGSTGHTDDKEFNQFEDYFLQMFGQKFRLKLEEELNEF